MNKRKIFTKIKGFTLVLVGIIGILSASTIFVRAATWSGPSAAPPGGNVDAPINVGDSTQNKTGNLTIKGKELCLADGKTPSGMSCEGSLAPIGGKYPPGYLFVVTAFCSNVSCTANCDFVNKCINKTGHIASYFDPAGSTGNAALCQCY